jgi:hypothetical protein
LSDDCTAIRDCLHRNAELDRARDGLWAASNGSSRRAECSGLARGHSDHLPARWQRAHARRGAGRRKEPSTGVSVRIAGTRTSRGMAAPPTLRLKRAAHVSCGLSAPHRCALDTRGMSAMPPISTELMRHNETSLGEYATYAAQHRYSITSSAKM